MNLKELIAADVDVFFDLDENARVALYNGREIVAVPQIGATNQKGNILTSDGMSDRASFRIKIADVPIPKSGDEIIDQGITWTVSFIAETNRTSNVVSCTSNESSFSR